jgi:hypothetical protein
MMVEKAKNEKDAELRRRSQLQAVAMKALPELLTVSVNPEADLRNLEKIIVKNSAQPEEVIRNFVQRIEASAAAFEGNAKDIENQIQAKLRTANTLQRMADRTKEEYDPNKRIVNQQTLFIDQQTKRFKQEMQNPGNQAQQPLINFDEFTPMRRAAAIASYATTPPGQDESIHAKRIEFWGNIESRIGNFDPTAKFQQLFEGIQREPLRLEDLPTKVRSKASYQLIENRDWFEGRGVKFND